MTKDYSKLRPFDLTAAMRGEPICFHGLGQPFDFIAGPDTAGYYVVLDCLRFQFYTEDKLRMAPLGWVEGKPVYVDDVLYSNDGDEIVVTEAMSNFGDNLTWSNPIGYPIVRFASFPNREFYIKPSGCGSCDNKEGTETCAFFNVPKCAVLTGSLCDFGDDGSYFAEVDKSE